MTFTSEQRKLLWGRVLEIEGRGYLGKTPEARLALYPDMVALKALLEWYDKNNLGLVTAAGYNKCTCGNPEYQTFPENDSQHQRLACMRCDAWLEPIRLK